ncbi:carboxypeptidase-like regulatory domain-containing protein [Bacteroides stercorirosoris]|uniref:DUF3869 domain-containing protein n=1 Tax=Bacteroides stercorirosoris TaxID=871324 RepID=A0A413GWV0_9BACE|nr:carboxypeptidase-like regulatory domain-containing protein [Bacteroides stercorirosoris]RGX75613.1 DUF3869 domain-containing protein [Bacteroides stercorirosoris]
MKKKSFFNGYNAKLALAVVALTGSLLTGCYKDEGLDIIDPDQSVTLPAAQYTITGTIYSAEGSILTTATVESDKGTIAQSGGSFTISGLSAGAVKVTASCTGFDKQETTVNIAELKPGQAAVYPVNFVLGKTATTKEVELRYDLKVTVLDEDMNIINDADVTVYGAGATEVDYKTTPLTAGAYKIKASKDGFVSTIQYITLPTAKKEVAIDFADAFTTEDYATEIVLVKTATGTVVLAGDLKFGDRWMLAKVVRLFNDKNTQFYGEGNSNTYAYKFNVPETEFVTATRAAAQFFNATFKIVDENGIELTMTQKIAKPEASTEPGGEEPNIEVKIDFSFNVLVTRTNATPTFESTKDSFDPMIVNGTEKVKKYTYDIPVLVGTEFISSSTGDLNNETAMGIAVKNAMKAATDTIQANGFTPTLVEKGYEFELAPYTGVKSITSKQEFTKFTLSVTQVTSTTTITVGEDVTEETTEVKVDLSGVNAVYNAAGKATVNYDDMEIVKVSHDHGHDHGHGTGNAGGGIIEAE